MHLLKLYSKALFRKEANCSERQVLVQLCAYHVKGTALQAAILRELGPTHPLYG